MSAEGMQQQEAAPEWMQIGDWKYHVVAHELLRQNEILRLEPRAAELLLYLAHRAGQVVSRDVLLEDLWTGMVVSDEALTNAVNKLRRAFDDDRARPQFIETIPKIGYRLIAPVKVITADATESNIHSGRPGWWLQVLLLVVLLTLTVFAVMTVLDLRKTSVDAINTRPALAVLPFDNLSAETDQDYYSDGITDDIITRLAKSPGLLVIARDSSFFYKGKSLQSQDVGKKLGVAYVLRGSIRRENNLIKLNTWLLDVVSGEHVWSEHYERRAGQEYELHNVISRSVLKTLGVKDTAVTEVAADTDNSLAYDKLLLGRYHFYKFQSKEENLKARAYFEDAIRLDSEFALAHAMRAWTYAFAVMNGWAEDRITALQQAEAIATRAIEIQPQLPLAYYVRGLAYREQQEYVQALVEAQKAIEYDPSDANGHVLLATLLYYAGRPQEGLLRIRQAMQINPHHPYNYHFHLGQAYFVLHRYTEAIEAFNHGLASNPASSRMRVWLAAALAYAGDMETAKWQAEQIKLMEADFSIKQMEQAFPFKNPKDMEHFLNGLRLAGLQ